MQKVTIIREEAESFVKQQNPTLTKIKQITTAVTLINELKNTQFSYKVESITNILQNIHGHFIQDTKQISVKQQQLLKRVEDPQFGNLTKLNLDMDKTVKRFVDFLQVKKQANKYKTLSGMMTKALESIESQVDDILEMQIKKRKK